MELEAARGLCPFHELLLSSGKVVHAHDLATLREQSVHHMAADESGATRDQDLTSLQTHPQTSFDLSLSLSTKMRMAAPRCEKTFFSSMSISANVLSAPSGTKMGS